MRFNDSDVGDLSGALLARLIAAWPLMAGMSAIGPLAIAAALWERAPGAYLGNWLLLSEAVAVAAIVLNRFWQHVSVRSALRLATLIALGNGLMVGVLMPLFFARDSLAAGLLPATVCAVAGSATIALQAHRPAMIALIVGSLGPMWLWALLAAPESRLAIVGLILLYAAMLIGYGLRAHSVLRELLALRLENRRLLIESERRRQLLEQANHAKTRFLAAASHDLRQPLSALSLQIDALVLRADASGRPALARLQHSTMALSELLDGLLDLSRLESPGLSVSASSVDIAQLLRDLQAEFQPAAEAKHLRLLARVPATLPHNTDPALLLRALRNLISNAIRYTDRGGVLLAARYRQGRVQIGVIDTGRGIAPDHQQRVFEEFFQVDADAGASGLGLGLALVARIVSALRGDIQLRSRLGRGSVFSILLPPLATQQRPLREDVATVDGGFPGRHVLVIEDDPENRYALHALLQHWGCEVVAVESLEAALLALVDARMAPDLLISDLHLGAAGDGAVAIERLRDEFNLPLPAIVLTAEQDAKRLVELAQSGIRVLRKPVSAAGLRVAVAELLTRI